MKKFIKKTLAGLIAGVMAVSSMPFTALADPSVSVNDFTQKTASAYGTFVNDENNNTEENYRTIYKNCLYSPTSMDQCYTSDPVSAEGKDKIYVRGRVFYGDTVLMYDGTTPSMGIGFAVTGQSKPWNYNYNNVRAYRCNISGDAQGMSFRDTKWHGNDGRMNYTYIMFSKSETIGTTSDSENKQGQNGYYGNVLQYTGGDFTSSYKSIQLGFEYTVGTDEGSHQTHQTGTITNATIYVLNYKKLIDKVNSVKNDLADFNASNYTDASVDAYYTAINNLYNFDPTSYDYSSNTASVVQTAAENMDNLISAVDIAKNNLEVKKYTYTFISSNGTRTTCEAQDDSTAYFWGVTSGKAEKTADTEKTYAGDNQHSWIAYSYPTEATNYEFVEKGEKKFEACNVVDGKCTICGESFIDYSAFDAAVAEAEALDNSKGVYSDESFAAYQAKVAEIKAKRDTVASQDELDALVAELATASDLLVKTTFTVKFVTVDENGNESTVEEKTFKYGESYAPTSDKNVEKWVVTTDNGNTTTKLNTFETSVTIIITKDAVVYAYQTDDAQTETSSKVTFYGKNGQIVAVKYVAKGEEIETRTVDVPEIPFYTAKGWDKETVTGTGSAISVKAVYESTAKEDDMCTVHFGDWSKAYSYDSYVYLPNADTSKKYALYDENDNLLTYLDGVDFYAPKRANIYVKEVTGEVTASIGITGSFSQRTSTTKSAVYNCKFYLPEGATAVEWGLEVTLNGKTAKVKGETKSERNEYSIRLNAPLSSSIDSVDGRAYVTYKTADGTPTTIYSSSVNQTL